MEKGIWYTVCHRKKNTSMITKLAILVFAFILIPILNTHAAETAIPDWIKNNAGWWAEGEIDDNSFVSGIQWLISNGIMSIPPTEQGTGSDGIPTWIKNNAGWWAEGEIDDNSFVSGIQWLISNGIIVIEQPESQQVVDGGGNCGSTDEVNIQIKNIPRDPVTLACTNGIVKCAEIEFVRPLDNFYEKCTTDSGMIVASSAVVPDEALYEMNRIILEMTQLHPEAAGRINALGIIAGVIGVDQGTTDMPEYKDLKNDPNVDWDQKGGLGATIFRPLVSAGEENLLCYTSDPWLNGQPGGESLGIHEISHTILEYGLVSSSMEDFNPYTPLPKSYWSGGQVLFNDLIAIYEEARNEGRWHDTYAGSNWTEFFATGTQMFFNAFDRSDDRYDNSDEYEFNTNREGLEQYEPKLVDYFETIYPVSWSYSCP